MEAKDFAQVLATYGDVYTKYTDDEKKGIAELEKLIDGDKDLEYWRKYAHRSLMVMLVRACHLDSARAYRTVKRMYLHATVTYPDLFSQIEPLQLRPIILQKLFRMVRRPTDTGPAILIFRVKNWKPSRIAHIEQLVLAALLYIYTLAKSSPEIQREGMILIVDAKGLKLSHVRQLSVELLMKAVKVYSSLPPLIKGIHIVNSLLLFEHFYSAVKWLLTENVRNLVYITKSNVPSNLDRLVNPDTLPREFGGNMADDQAYIQDIEAAILRDKDIFQLIKHLQDEFLRFSKECKK